MSKRKEIKNEPAFILLQIDTIKENPNNPRVIIDDKYKKLVKSIQDFPQMLRLRPLVIDENNIVLGGNMRLKALRELKYKNVPCIYAKDLSEEQKKEFIIKDNLAFGEWDMDILANEWDNDLLKEWGFPALTLYNYDGDIDEFFEGGVVPEEEEGKHVIKLVYEEETFDKVKKGLLAQAKTYELAVLKLLGIETEQ